MTEGKRSFLEGRGTNNKGIFAGNSGKGKLIKRRRGGSYNWKRKKRQSLFQ